MKKYFKFALLLLLPFGFGSCNNDNDSITESTNTAQINSLKLSEAKLLYFEILNSKDQHEAYNNLDYRKKALVWQGKFEDFISNSDLSNEQLEVVNRIKSKLTESFFNSLEENYNSDEIKNLEFESMQKLGNLRAISLFYTMENYYLESSNQQKCFWCDNEIVTVDGPCYFTNINGNWHYVEQITTKKIRFWITVGYWETVQPCTQ